MATGATKGIVGVGCLEKTACRTSAAMSFLKALYLPANHLTPATPAKEVAGEAHHLSFRRNATHTQMSIMLIWVLTNRDVSV